MSINFIGRLTSKEKTLKWRRRLSAKLWCPLLHPSNSSKGKSRTLNKSVQNWNTLRYASCYLCWPSFIASKTGRLPMQLKAVRDWTSTILHCSAWLYWNWFIVSEMEVEVSIPSIIDLTYGRRPAFRPKRELIPSLPDCRCFYGNDQYDGGCVSLLNLEQRHNALVIVYRAKREPRVVTAW